MRSAPATRSAGFTLVELLISLVIIGIISASVVPSLSEVLADSRQLSATHHLLRMSRRARSLTLSSGVAHLFRFQNTGAAGSNGLGVIELFEGMNGHCSQTPWDQAFTALAAGQGRVDILDMAQFNPTGSVYDAVRGSWTGTPPASTDQGRHVIRLTAALANNALTAFQVCYQPNGQTFTSSVATTNPPLAPQAQDITVTVSRTVNGVQRGQVRAVVFRPGAAARVQ